MGAQAKNLIVNADDFGASTGVNRGIIDCHTRGVVTSASLMVTGRAADEAAVMSREHPDMSIGLHWDVWGEDERDFELSDHAAVRDEFMRQLDRFHTLIGVLPTHIDSHRHAHRKEELTRLFSELVEPLGVPFPLCVEVADEAHTPITAQRRPPSCVGANEISRYELALLV
jgi:predicted glycoside hydrolase/deacetylase ChbG (UPF0249 family)